MIPRGLENENARHFDAIEWRAGEYALQLDGLTRDRQRESIRTDMLGLMCQLENMYTNVIKVSSCEVREAILNHQDHCRRPRE